VVNFAGGATERTTKLQEQINELKFNKEAKNKMDFVATLKSSASSFLFRELWDQANTKLEEAKGVLNELSQVRDYFFSIYANIYLYHRSLSASSQPSLLS
jgi:hypothetical protein